MPKITKKNKKDRQTVKDWFRSKEGQKALAANDLMLDPQGRPISVMLPEAEVSTLGNASRDLSKDFLEGIRYGAGMMPLLGETLDYAESAYANKYGTDFFGNPMHGPLNAGITTAGIVVPNVVEKPAKTVFKVVKNTMPKIGPKLKKFESSIDWGKWNPDTPKNKELMKEYREIEKRTKEDGTWMKNPDGTNFDGPPELFIQMQSKAFKKAFPEGFDRLYRGVHPIDGEKISPIIQTPNSSGPTFFSGDRKQAAQYAGHSGNRILGADYHKKKRGVFDVAYPPNTSRLDIDTRGSNWEDVRKYDEEDIQKRIEKINQKIEGRKSVGTNWWPFLDDIWYINKGTELEAPKRVSSDEEIAAFLDKYRDWAKANPNLVSRKDVPSFYRDEDDLLPADAISTDDFQAFMERNPDLYDRVVFRGLNDDGFGDVNIVNAGKAPYPKSLKGNVGTFDLNDPNVFKALIPAVGAGAIMSQKKKDGMASGGKVSLIKNNGDPVKLVKDPPKGYRYNAKGQLVPVGWSEDHGEQPNYLNLARLDSIVQAPYQDIRVPFSEFRDKVRSVEAGPDSKDPYRQVQLVEVDGVKLPVGVGKGAYQFDYPTAVTAYNRLQQIAVDRDMGYPEISDEELKDVTLLPPELQDMLFTAHFAKDPATSVKKVLTDPKSHADQWYVGHYKGEDEGRKEHFRSITE